MVEGFAFAVPLEEEKKMRLAPLRKMLACFVALCMTVASVPLMPQRALAESPTVSGGDTYPEEFIVGGGDSERSPRGVDWHLHR